MFGLFCLFVLFVCLFVCLVCFVCLFGWFVTHPCISLQRFYIATSRQLERLVSVTRSPIYSHFQESIDGASSIRAYRQQQRFSQECERRVDNNNIVYYLRTSANRWAAFVCGICVPTLDFELEPLHTVLGFIDSSDGWLSGLSLLGILLCSLLHYLLLSSATTLRS